MSKLELSLTDLTKLKEVADQIINFAGPRKKWGFYGNLGAGKTTIIKAICAQLGLHDTVSSPTYSLVNEYAYSRGQNKQIIYHMDLYRLNSFEEALDIGIEDYLDSDAYCFLEWPEIIEAILPEDILKIYIETDEKGHRKITCY